MGVNHMYANRQMYSKLGKPYTGRFMRPEAAAWKEQASLMAKLAMNKARLVPIFREYFSVDCFFRWRDKRSQLDHDGALKLLLDAMNKVVYSSDKFALPRVLGCAFDAVNPGVDVLVAYPPTQLQEVVAHG